MNYNIISNIALVVYILYKSNDDFKKNTMITDKIKSINRRLDKTILTINERLDSCSTKDVSNERLDPCSKDLSNE